MYMEQQPKGTRLYLLSPVMPRERKVEEQLAIWRSEGFARLMQDGKTIRLTDDTIDEITDEKGRLLPETYLMVDRVVVDHEQATSNHFADSVQTAFFEGYGECVVWIDGNKRTFREV